MRRVPLLQGYGWRRCLWDHRRRPVADLCLRAELETQRGGNAPLQVVLVQWCVQEVPRGAWQPRAARGACALRRVAHG
jgi:hypothetical protein